MMKLFLYIGLLLIFFTLINCEEKESGCLNPLSPSYDIDADVPCDDCCEYQKLTVNFRINFEEETFQKDSAYLDANMDSIFVTELEFVLSSFEMAKANDTSLVSLKRLENDSINIPDDLIFVNSAAVNQTAIEYEYENSIDSLYFRFGMPDILKGGAQSFEDENYQLIRDSLYNVSDAMFSALKMSYLDKDSSEYDIQIDDFLFKDFEVPLDTFINRAQSISLTIEFDLKTFWGKAQLLGSQDDISAILQNNLNKAITIN